MKPITTRTERITQVLYDRQVVCFAATGFESVRSLFAFISRTDIVTTNVHHEKINDSERKKEKKTLKHITEIHLIISWSLRSNGSTYHNILQIHKTHNKCIQQNNYGVMFKNYLEYFTPLKLKV
jgi:hypothetical protein